MLNFQYICNVIIIKTITHKIFYMKLSQPILKLLIVTLLSVLSFTINAKDNYIKLVEKADKAINDDKYEEAIQLLTEALNAEPDNSGNVMLISNLGMLYYYTGQDSLAIDCLSLAHEMAPESITILGNKAKVLMETGQYDRVMPDLIQLTEIDSTLVQPLLNIAIIQLSRGDIDNAAITLERVKKMTDTSKSQECSAALAWLASIQGDDRQALEHYTALINIEPSASLYASRAMSHIELEHYIEASEDIAAGIEMDPECAELYVARAYLNRRTYRNDDAMKDAQKAIDMGANRDRIRQLLNL